MEVTDPTSIKHLEQWKKDFDFDGKLNSGNICRLIGRIEQKAKNNPKKAESFHQMQKWLIESQKRKWGIHRKKGDTMFHRKEDDEPQTGRARQAPPRQLEQAVGGQGESEHTEKEGGLPTFSAAPASREPLYPSLVAPPPYNEPESQIRTRSQTRQEGTKLEWYNKMNSVVKGKGPGKTGGGGV